MATVHSQSVRSSPMVKADSPSTLVAPSVAVPVTLRLAASTVASVDRSATDAAPCTISAPPTLTSRVATSVLGVRLGLPIEMVSAS